MALCYQTIRLVIVSMTKFQLVIGFSHAYLLGNRRAITRVFNEPFYRCHTILTFFLYFSNKHKKPP